MCERLFDKDAYIKEFDAVVTDCLALGDKGEYLVALDRTAFYPEGGGQPGDTGYINDIRVLDTFEKDGHIYHKVERAIEPGTRVRGAIDWERRFSLMQNHSGEHIVSGLIHTTFGYENVGFHMGSEFITIDLSGELTMEQLSEIQRGANEIIWQDVRTDIRFYDGSDSIPFAYRSKKRIEGQVRIVTFPGADICACCGTHVSSTGQIGLIKIISCVKFKGGVRVEMLCGQRALAYLDAVWEQNHRISNLLSARPLQTANAVQRVRESEDAARFELMRMERLQEEQFAAGMAGRGDLVILSGAMHDPQAVRRLANAVMEVSGGICAVFAGEDAETNEVSESSDAKRNGMEMDTDRKESHYKYAIGEKDGDVRELVKAVNQKLSGRGGGKPFFAQGSVSANRKEIEALFAEKPFKEMGFAIIEYGVIGK